MTVLRRLTSVITASAAAMTLAAVPASAFTPVSPSGVDVSSHQRGDGQPIHWREVAADGQRYAFVKASEGTDWVNPHYLEDVHAAHAAGLIVGTYHYARPSQDARTQAAHYAAALAAAPQHSLPPVLDIEVAEGQTPEQLQGWVREFVDEVGHLTGRTPMIYTYSYFWREHLADTHEFADHPLWLAAYQNEAPAPVGGWNHLTFWQRSDSGRVRGIAGDVDLNLFNGDEGQLRRFVAGNHIDPGASVTDGFALPSGGDVSADLQALGADNRDLANLILAAGTGIVAVSTVVAAAEHLGLTSPATEGLAGQVTALIESGDLPVEDLRTMADNPDYTIGDLLILLDNAKV